MPMMMHPARKIPMTPEIDIAFADDVACDEDLLRALIQSSIEKTIEIAQLRFVENGEVSFLFASDETLQSVNREWRAKDKPTNVLSFPTDVIELGKVTSPMLGDIAISLETAKREADLENKSYDHHLTHLIVHGFLHLFGYDHEKEEEAIQMETLETKILQTLGIADPYQL